MIILYPLFAMVVLTLLLMPLSLIARIRAIGSGRLSLDALRLSDLSGAPEQVIKTDRHFINLFEVPVLFYIACLTAFLLRLDHALLVVLAWAYVSFRAAHSFIHLTYNKVVHRTAAWLLSNSALYVMWFIIILNGIDQ